VRSSQSQRISRNMGFASAVAEFGMLLRGSTHGSDVSFDAMITRARQFRGDDPDGYRAELIKLAEVAKGLQGFR